MRLLHLFEILLLFGIACSINVHVNMTSHRTVPERFLSVTLDSLSAMPDTWTYLNFSFMTPLARALGPSYFRFGGSYSDIMVFNQTNNGQILQPYPGCVKNAFYGNNCIIFTADQFDQLYSFAKDSGWRFIYDLNIMMPNGSDWTVDTIKTTRWNSTNAEKLLNYASSKGYEMDWELGNEPDGFPGIFYNIQLDGNQLAQAFMDLRALMKANSLYEDCILVGPDAYGINWAIEQFVHDCKGQCVDALTDHQYYLEGAGSKVADFLNVSTLDSYRDYLNSYINVSKNFSPLWMGETGSAWGSGAPNMSDRYIAGFLLLDKLGLSAKMGVDVVVRQTLVGAGGVHPWGYYTVLNRNLKPNPDYWLTFLYKKLVGTTVYDVSIDQTDSNLRLYAASSRNNDGYLVYGEYLAYDQVTIDLPELTNKQVVVYLFKEGEAGNLQSELSRLNGELLDWDTHKPLANIKGNSTTLPVTLPGPSLFFIAIPPKTSQSCPDGWYQEQSEPNKCLRVVNYTQPWFGGNFDCKTYGINASLLSVGSAFENAEISRFAQTSGCDQLHIGLYRNESNWLWSNGDASSYRNWKSGYPTNDIAKNCVTFDQATGTWMNSDCDTSLCYICQMYY